MDVHEEYRRLPALGIDRRDDRAEDAAISLRDEWTRATLADCAEMIGSVYVDGGGMTCAESDALVSLYRLWDLDIEADQLEQMHAESDEEGDAHYLGDAVTS